MGNNHILNFGEGGLEQTKRYLGEAGVGYFGADDLRFKIYDLGGNKIAFVCYNQFEEGAVERAERDIRGVKGERGEKGKADMVILYTHWGKEYEVKANALQKDLAHQFIGAGADLIIGSHPHVVQEKEIYNGKTTYPHTKNMSEDMDIDNANKGMSSNNKTNSDFGVRVYYSLGNFIFDQYFDPNAAKGLAVEVVIDPDGSMQFTEYQVQMKTNGQTLINN